MTRVAVVGHVEWVEFVRVRVSPPRGGLEQATRLVEHAGGGAVVAATVLAQLGAEVEFFCALGDDERAARSERELSDRGVTVHAARRSQPSRFVFTMLDDGGERTIVTVGERLQPAGADPLPWERLADVDGVYFTAGDDQALGCARRAERLVVTPRAGDHAAGLRAAPTVDATVFSAHDTDEQRWAADWEPHSSVMVATEGERGGRWWGASTGRWTAVPPPGPIRDSYGCGDSFAAGLTFGLASGASIAEAAAVGARVGAEMLTRVGAP
ncbi:MAG TPA: PfkB family carbohydrate kinase [Solirubrobacteraceae bacterium]|nr:PfkB family carbohydrate kinase [Solirubrobacteraceae bacterium]